VTEDPQAARVWFERAAEGGHPQAPGTLGRLGNSGALGDAQRYETAVRWYDQGLERGDGWSGANAAWIIAERGVEGLTPADAAERAAKAASLGNAEAAASARKALDALPASARDAAAQRLINALGGSVATDGDFGPASRVEMARVLDAHGAAAPPDDPTERAVALARVYWAASKFRVDLY
jgi:TPR repeat protein